ncbi:MAG: response regulator transcription factor ParR [Shewanella algae]
MKEKILLIEDDLPLAGLICTYLANEGFELVHLDNAEAALARQDSDSFSLILCDVMLPGEDGFGIYPRLAACYPCPLIFLTARDSEGDQILGLELGACDYLLKPVVPPLLLARIRTQLRNRQQLPGRKTLCLHDLQLDPNQQQVFLAGSALAFTTKEFELLWVFVINAGRVLSREYLFEQFIGRAYDGLDRAIDLKVSRLRKRLDELEISGLQITTVHGKGYLFNYQPNQAMIRIQA